MDPDRDVLDRWRSGDQQAGRDLFARYFDPLFRFFGNKCTEPDELIQTTFLAIVKAKDQFGGRSSFRTYLFTIARNQLYRHMRELKHNALFDPNLSSVAELATSVGSRVHLPLICRSRRSRSSSSLSWFTRNQGPQVQLFRKAPRCTSDA